MKTRYILYPLLTVLAMLLPTSCSFEEDVFDAPAADGNKISFTMDVSLVGASNVESRAFGETDFSKIESLHIAVFEVTEDGSYLKEFLDNDDIKLLKENDGDGCWKFNVTITKAGAATDKKYRLHLIANYPGLTMPFGEEGQLMGLLETQANDKDVYWNFVELTSISESSVTYLQHVPLVRNYVQIKIDANSNFTGLTNVEYALYNVPTKGRVAAYNTNPEATSTFANFVNGTACQTYDNLLGTQKYAGNEAYDDGSLLSKNLTWKATSAVSYMYERNHSQRTNPTCMLIRGTYNGSTSYYKLDFVDNNENYYNLLRNFIYTMKVTEVKGPGYDSAEKALNQPAGNNISGDTKTATFTNISDGTSQLYVSTTSILFTHEQPVYLYYKYIPNITNPSPTNEGVTISGHSGGTVLDKMEEEGKETMGQYPGWYRVKLTPKAIPAIAAFQELTFTAGGLKRTVKLQSQPPFTGMTLNVVQDKVQAAAGQDITLQITLPAGIPESLFPLRLFIRSAGNTIYPDYGKDMPAEAQNGKYGFIKEVSYSDAYTVTYDENEEKVETPKTIVCDFLTNCGNSATTVYVENQYLDDDDDTFDNEKITSVKISNGLAVKIQTQDYDDRWGGSLSVYPKAINNSNNNNNSIGDNKGTETVTVTFNGETTSITISSTEVTSNDITFTRDEGFDINAELTFTFRDQYCTNATYDYWDDEWTVTWSNSNSNNLATYTATCTVADLLDPEYTLNFTRQR